MPEADHDSFDDDEEVERPPPPAARTRSMPQPGRPYDGYVDRSLLEFTSSYV
jgi:hypothetical protein